MIEKKPMVRACPRCQKEVTWVEGSCFMGAHPGSHTRPDGEPCQIIIMFDKPVGFPTIAGDHVFPDIIGILGANPMKTK